MIPTIANKAKFISIHPTQDVILCFSKRGKISLFQQPMSSADQVADAANSIANTDESSADPTIDADSVNVSGSSTGSNNDPRSVGDSNTNVDHKDEESLARNVVCK